MRRKFGFPIHSNYYPVQSDCVLYQAFWDGTLVDHSIYDHASITGADFVTNGLSFNGSGDYCQITYDIHLSPETSDYAIMAWVWVDSTAPSTYPVICSTNGGDIMLMSTPSKPNWFDYSQFVSHTIQPYYRYNTVTASCDAWHFITYEIDRDVAGYARLDGNVLAAPFGPIDLASIIFADPFYLGLYGSNYFKGIIGEIYIFKGTFGNWSGGTSLDIYNATRGRYGV